MIQAVDYVPIESQVLSDVDGQTQYWPYKKAGRSFRISKKRDGIVLPIGILGKCVKASIANCREDIIYADIPEDENYVEYLIKQWNFSKIIADRLTKGRQSFVCIPRMDSAKSRILFIIYLDARRGAIFDDLTEEKIEDHLRLITQTLTAE